MKKTKWRGIPVNLPNKRWEWILLAVVEGTALLVFAYAMISR
tara:strand:+ start:456 stop:581 length:126 start_codon:yes stop_codon:yes gene_type:complete